MTRNVPQKNYVLTSNTDRDWVKLGMLMDRVRLGTTRTPPALDWIWFNIQVGPESNI